MIDDYFMAFPKPKAWPSNTQKFIQANGFIYSHLAEKEDYQMCFSDKGIASHEVRWCKCLRQSVASDVNLPELLIQKHIVQTGMKAKIFALVHTPYLQKFPKTK